MAARLPSYRLIRHVEQPHIPFDANEMQEVEPYPKRELSSSVAPLTQVVPDASHPVWKFFLHRRPTQSRTGGSSDRCGPPMLALYPSAYVPALPMEHRCNWGRLS